MLTQRFQRAFAMASEVHARQLRKGTTIPYVAHVMSVAALVLEHGGGEDAAISGLLHDAVEDSDDGESTLERIRAEFGDRVADTVLGCSDAVGVPGQAKPPWRERKEAYLRRLAESRDPDVPLVSACDKLHNSRAIVADLRAIGSAVWQRFSAPDPEAQLWYYRSLARSYAGRVPPALSGEVARMVAEMRTLAGA
ncbi:MAG: HD domain-containing protein [Nocardiopsaceae bacterium]|nr:HD domain-containing protein [Nocardiopsaceae bacterium]